MPETLDYSEWSLTFSDEFNDLNLWNGTDGVWKPQYHWGDDPINGEMQFYVDPQKSSSGGVNPFSIENGILTIEAAPTPDHLKANFDNRDYTSGVLTTEKTFSQTYGYFEVSAQVPAGKGLWPAFWLLPTDLSWPPELDVMEILGQQPERVYMTSHSKQAATDHHDAIIHDTSQQFTKFGVEWTPTELIWYIDGVEVARGATPGDMHKPMYMLANLAVGGGWPGAPNENTEFPAEYQIDYIRAYTRGEGDGGGVLEPVGNDGGGGETSSAAPGPNGELAVVLSHATGGNGEQIRTGGHTLYPEQPSSTTLTGADMNIGGVAGSAAATVTRDANGAVDVKLDSEWNSVKNVYVADDEAGSVTLDNFVHTDVSLGDGGDSAVKITGAKRGNVVTGDGNDTIDIALQSNSSTGNTFRVESGAGDDVIRITGSQGSTQMAVDAGAGDDVIDIGGGANTLTGGAGADTYVLSALDVGLDQVRGFNAGEGDRIEIGRLLNGYDPASSNIADFVELAEIDGSTRLQIDADGTGGGGVVEAAVLQGVTGLSTDAILYNGTPISSGGSAPTDGGVLEPVGNEEPQPTDPEPTDPVPTDPEPTEPEPTEPEPTTGNETPTPVAAGATSVVFSHATGADGEQVRDDSFTHVAEQAGTTTITGADMAISGVAADAAATVTRDEAGAVSVGLDSPWNTVKNVYVSEDEAGTVTVDNFVHADVALGDGGDSTVAVTGAKRGSVVTGDGDDTVEIGVLSNSSGTGNTFRVETGAGNDTIRLQGGQSYSRAVIDAGAGDDVIDAGAGAHALTGGAGADTYVFGVDDGTADEVFGFNAAEGDVVEIGGLLSGFDPANSNVAEFVALEESEGHTTVRVDLDGAAGGDGFADVAVLRDVTGLGLDALVQDGAPLGTSEPEPAGEGDVIEPVDTSETPPEQPTDPEPTTGNQDPTTVAGASSVVFSHATGANGEQIREDSYTHLAEQAGATTITGAEMAIAGVAADAAATVTRDEAGALDIALDSPWNSVKNVYVTEEDAGAVTIDNFVHADVALGDGGDSTVSISGAKRGSVATGDGDDLVEIAVLSNSSGTGNTFEVDTGSGNDTIRLQGGQSYSRAVIDAGDGDDVIDAGAGEHALTGGAGADTYVFSVVDATVDEVFGFNADEGDSLDLGALLDGFDPATSDLAEFVALSESSGGTTVAVDSDGAAGGSSFANVAMLHGVNGVGLEDLVQEAAPVAA